MDALMPCGAYGLMTCGLGLLIGLAVRRGARLALFTSGQCSPQPALAAERAELRIIVPGIPGTRAIVGTPPIHLRVWARLDDPRREYNCPEWVWRWDATRDGETSTAAVTSCDPFALEGPDEYRSPDARHVYRWPGTYRLEVVVIANGRERRASREVIVIGPSLEDYR